MTSTNKKLDTDSAEAPDKGVGCMTGSASLARELAEPNGMLRYTLTQQVKRLRKLADEMEEEGKCLKILGTTEKRIPHAFSRGAEMCGAADMARDWAENLEALLPNTPDHPRENPQ
jgi:acyl-CoA reductase-like NAD-dependent aldehyde dehydrogenase